MPNAKISALPAVASPVAGTVQIPVVQAGVTKVATAADIRNTPEPFIMTGQATGSVTPAAAGTTKMYARSYAGRVMPEFMGENGMDCFIQPALFNNAVFLLAPGTGTAIATSQTVWGGAVSLIAGTITNVAITSTSIQTSMRRVRYITAATAGTAGGIRSTDPVVLRGNVVNTGGFFAFFRFTQTTNVLGNSAFVGLYGSTTALSANGPGDMISMVGIGYGGSDAIATGWRLYMNDATGTATAINLTGAPRDTTTVLDLTLWAPSNGTSITARVYNQSTQSVVLDNVTYTTDLPVNTTPLYAHAQCRTPTTTTANIELARIYIESDI